MFIKMMIKAAYCPFSHYSNYGLLFLIISNRNNMASNMSETKVLYIDVRFQDCWERMSRMFKYGIY